MKRARTLIVALALAWACVGSTVESSAEESADILRLLAVAPGSSVADVGAGEGEWTLGLLAATGPEGAVIATEIDTEKLAELRRLARDHPNLAVVAGDQESSGLAPGCCDAILLRLVYHHFQDPEAMRRDLVRALRPGAQLLVIDIRPQEHWRKLDGVPERGGHGVEPAEVARELEAEGLRLLDREDDWQADEDRFALVFEKPRGEP